ncbi:MAG: metallophosphoesterase [Promethearchaeota archaeon]
MLGNFTEWGPYLSFGTDASKEIRVCWKTAIETKDGWVRFGKTQECDKIEYDTIETPSRSHIVTLKDLDPSTKYYYRISAEGYKTYEFKTGPAFGSNEPFEFTVIGDMHAYPCNNLERYFDLMLELCPEHLFSIAVGDSINDGENDEHWNSFFYFGREYLPFRPHMNATGNHDTGNKKKYSKFLRAYYTMKCGNAVFFFIDSNNAGGWSPTPSDEQYDWLVENLERYALKDNWIFLFMHHQIYSTGDFGCEPIMHEFFRPLCQQYHVDAVFYGHDHHYECFWVDRDTDWGGTLFFVSGAGGGQHHVDYGIMGDRDGKTKYKWPGRFLNVRKHGVPPPTSNISVHSRWHRNDDLVRKCQLLGVLEPHFVQVRIEGDMMELKALGWQKQAYHRLKVKRAGQGRKFSKDSELTILDY